MEIDTSTKANFLQGLHLMKNYLMENYVSKEMSLNTRPQDYKGENAKDETLPADWVDKLKPLSGGPDGGRAGDSGPETKSTGEGSQSDPYIHKQVADALMAVIKQMQEPMAMGGEEIPEEDTGDEMMWDTDDVGSAEEGAEGVDDMMGGGGEMGMDEGMDKMGHDGGFTMDGGGDNMDNEIVDALNQIKGILSQVDFQKQQTDTMENAMATMQKSFNDKLANMQKDIQKQANANAAKQVNATVQQILKAQGLAPTVSETPKRMENTVVSKAEATPAPLTEDLSDRSESFGKSDDDNDGGNNSPVDTVGDIQKSFSATVSSIVNRTGKDNLYECFRFVNAMRLQNEGDLTVPIHYYEDVV